MSTYHNTLLEDDEPKTLGDWVRNFRVKKTQMKRKLRGGGDLRICAILTTALLNAEHELRRKQQERFTRWLDFQTKIQKDFRKNSNRNSSTTTMRSCASEVNMMTSFSSDYEIDDDDAKNKQRDEINDLWRSELNSLDEFMRSISNKTHNNSPSLSTISTTKESGGGAEHCDKNSFNVVNIEIASIRESSTVVAMS